MSTAASFCSTSIGKVQEIINGRQRILKKTGSESTDEIRKIVEQGLKEAGNSKISAVSVLKGIGSAAAYQSEKLKREYESTVRELSEKNVEAILDNQLDELIRKYTSGQETSLLGEDKKEKVRQLIRGYFNTVFVREDIIEGYAKEVEDIIRNGIEKNTGKAMNSVTELVNAYSGVEAEIMREISLYEGYLNRAKNLEAEMDKLMKLESVEEKARALDSKIKGSIGVDLNLGENFNRIMSETTRKIGQEVERQISPQVTEAAALISRVKDSINTATEFIEREKNLVNETVEKWKTTLTSRIQAEEKRIVQNIVASIKLKW